uniref:Uncharacterized protein n=1 Tax=Arundo donax TaxID=35708 RepID=A0A0A9CR19_ARUDO
MPPRRRRRASPAKSQLEPEPPKPPGADAPLAERLIWVSDQEGERRIAAIKAIADAESESLDSRLELMKSYCSEEQLELSTMEFFRENFLNLSTVRNERFDVLQLKWKDGGICRIGDLVDDTTLQASVASLPTVGGLQFPGDSVGKDFYGHTSFGLGDFACSELPAGQIAGAADAFQTPGAVSNRLSFGMTPKTVRLPKNGEMLLSVHGSPLGVYKEENLAAIQESGNGSEDAPC